MHQNSIQKIAVCGAGTMGSGIAETAARAGFETVLYDPAAAALSRAKEAITRNLMQLVDKEKISAEEKTSTLSRLQFHDQVEACKADLVIEAIVEKTNVKQALFAQLAALNLKAMLDVNDLPAITWSWVPLGTSSTKQVGGSSRWTSF